MIRRAAAVVLTAAVLTGCGAGPELAALQDQRLADLSQTEVAESVHEYSRLEKDAETVLGKPVYASVHANYRLTSDPEETFEQIRQIAIDDGWDMQGPRDGYIGLIVTGEKDVAGYRGDLSITFIAPGDPIPSGGTGPVALVRMRAMP